MNDMNERFCPLIFHSLLLPSTTDTLAVWRENVVMVEKKEGRK